MRFSSERGQATVEAAVLLPALFMILGLLLQPAILFYDRSVMSAAASESCRLVATNTMGKTAAKGYVIRRLGRIPNIGVFHVGGKRGWKVSLEGPDDSGKVTVRVANTARPLPLFGVVAGLGNDIDASGNVAQRVEASSCCIPVWAAGAGTPQDWIGAWQ